MQKRTKVKTQSDSIESAQKFETRRMKDKTSPVVVPMQGGNNEKQFFSEFITFYSLEPIL